jgi:tRNA G26 N,N-dimethylase Trm1
LSGTTILYKAFNEINQPFYYYIPSLNIQEKINKIIEKLKKKSFKASRTVFENQGIKTNAKKDEIEKLFL